MRSIVLASFVLLAAAGGFAPGEEAPTSAAGKKLIALKKKFDVDEAELKKKAADAKDPEDKKQIAFLTKELYAFTASDALELAEENKKEEAGLECAVSALRLYAMQKITGADMEKAGAIILDNHLNNEKIQPLLAPLSEVGAYGTSFLKAVVEKSTNNEVLGVASYYTALAMDGDAANREGNGDEMGAARVRGEAVALMEKAIKLAPKAKIGTELLEKAALNEMVGLKISVGNPIPDIEGTDLEGKKVKLSSYKGKVVLFDFWATWCGPCVAMIPHERDLIAKVGSRHFSLLSVNVDEEKSALTEFLEKEKMPWNHWYDGPTGPVTKLFKIKAFPTLYLIDAKGIIRKKWLGSPGNDVLDKAVEELVAEAAKEKK